jgi:hypothetical protein
LKNPKDLAKTKTSKEEKGTSLRKKWKMKYLDEMFWEKKFLEIEFFFFCEWKVWALLVLFDVLYAYKAQKLTKMLSSKDGRWKGKNIFLGKKTVI